MSRALVHAAGENLRRLDRPPPAGTADPAPPPRTRRPPGMTRATPAAGREATAPTDGAAHPRAAGSGWRRPTATAVLTGIGVGVGVGQRLADAALRR